MRQKLQTYLALGDSYTIGEAVPAEENFPNQLVRLLRQQGLAVTDPQIIAKTGWTVAELDEGINSAAIDQQFDLVTLLIGVNDQYRGYSRENYRQQLEQMIARATGYCKTGHSGTLLISIPDWGLTPFAADDKRGAELISREIDAYNSIKAELAEQANLRFIDITGLSRLPDPDGLRLTADRLHPSGLQYADWARKILPFAEEVLKANPL